MLLTLYHYILPTTSFSSHTASVVQTTRSTIRSDHTTQLHLFRKDNKDPEDATVETAVDEDTKDSSKEQTTITPKKNFLPFFARPWSGNNNNNNNNNAQQQQPEKESLTTATVTTSPPPLTKSPPTPQPMDPSQQAAKLRSEAEKIRLEAERMDAELTLQKIAKLEDLLLKTKNQKEQTSKQQTNVQDLQRELQQLQAKLRGEPPKPTIKPASSSTTTTTTPSSGTVVLGDSRTPTTTSSSLSSVGSLQDTIWSVLGDNQEEIIESIDVLPGFMKKAMAVRVGLDYSHAPDETAMNSTELAIRLSQMVVGDFSYSDLPPPTFTDAEIQARKAELQNDKITLDWLSEKTKEQADDERLALLSLQYDYYVGNQAEEGMMKVLQEEEWLKPVVEALNKTEVDTSIETLFPKCTRKGQQPTMPQVQQFVAEILPKVPFSTTSKPEPVAGGYVIRGNARTENGDDLVAAIDKQLERSSLNDKLTVLYTNDFTIFSDPEAFETYDPSEATPILYITGPNIVREPRRIALSIVSAFGLASSWYLSIYPFLLNPAIAKRVEDELSLADMGSTPNLDWLSELSVPLFLTFVSIQLLHEAGHQIVSSANKVKLTAPTFVPSLITGITSSVTTFKTPPKNHEQMFDISVAGPMLGILGSLFAIAVGSQLTLTSDPSMLPALPLDILRQSTLGGGIIDAILGNGALAVPDGAIGTAAVSGITIPLHPVAVAGYISLVVNALAVLPIGSTYKTTCHHDSGVNLIV